MVRLNTALFLAFFCLAGLLLVVILREIQKSHDYQTRLEYFQTAQEYSLGLDTAYREIRKFKHDYKNLFLGLSGYLDAGDLPGMKDYFSRTLLPLCESIDSSFEQSALALLEIPEVRGLCLAKALQAKSKGISIKFFIPSPAASLRMDMMDLLRLLGIYFDNSIEAAEKADVKNIEFRLFPNGDRVTLTLANTYG
ncbi:MAG: GHKL domain-containing protein, partial [Oscillospiraceae bacterium]|nr:GHKL domain-containing protein [Oscillospiraceae bacterium]